MKLIATATVGATPAGIDFIDIPQSFTDLFLQISVRSTATGGPDVLFYFNGITTGYSMRRLYSTGLGVASDTAAANGIFTSFASYTANTFGSSSIYISNYTSNTNKVISIDTVSENNAAGSYAGVTYGLWSNTASINRINFPDASLTQHSTISLYGITKGSDGITTAS
jgi:hypothetical protein